MKKNIWLVLSAILAAANSATPAGANGFRITEQSASAMAMANAFAGQADDPSAVWYNPAGITQLDGTQVSGGVIGFFPVLTHENATVNPGTTDVSQRDLQLQPNLYLTSPLGNGAVLGFGITSPFGLATDWDPSNSSTRYVSTYSKVVTVELNPNIAYKVNDRLSLAAGIAYISLRAVLERITPDPFDPTVDRNFRLSGDGDGWGANAALRYKPIDNVGIGLSYRSRIKVRLEGDAEIAGTPLADKARTPITLPDIITAGVSYHATDRLILNADVEYTWWSTYDRLVVSSAEPAFNFTEEKQWENVWGARVGAQYTLSEAWKLRAGYLYDGNPVKQEYFENSVPDADLQTWSIGAGCTIGRVTVDAGYSYVRFKKRSITDSLMDDAAITPLAPDALNGTYRSEAHLVGITVGYRY